MAYEVKGADGRFQGPYEDSDIREWVTSGQLDAKAIVRDFQTGYESTAVTLVTPMMGKVTQEDNMSGKAVVLLPPDQKRGFKGVMTATDGTAEFAGAIIFSAITVGLCIAALLTPIPSLFTLLTAVGAGIYAFRCYSEAHDKANLAIGVVIGAGVISLAVIAFSMTRPH